MVEAFCPAHQCHHIQQSEFNTISAVGPGAVHNMVSVAVEDHLEEAKCLPEQQDVVQVVRSFDKRRNIPSNPNQVQETPEKETGNISGIEAGADTVSLIKHHPFYSGPLQCIDKLSLPGTC